MTDRAVGDINEEDNREKELLKEEGSAQAKDHENEGSESSLRLPVKILKAGVGDITDHQECDG